MHRDYPWHLWQPTPEHSNRIRHLVDLNELTTSWLSRIKNKQNLGPYQLQRVFSPGADENLNMLEKLTHALVPTHMNAILNDLSPENFIEKLESTIWSTQMWSLNRIYHDTPLEEHAALKNELCTSSFMCGKNASLEKWPHFPFDAREDLKAILSSLRDTPFSGYPHGSSFLLRKSSKNHICIELLSCPHQQKTIPIENSAADDLCLFQMHWIRGFIYEINTQITFEYLKNSTQSTRGHCIYNWNLRL